MLSGQLHALAALFVFLDDTTVQCGPSLPYGLLPVSPVFFLPLSQICHLASINIYLYTVPLSVFLVVFIVDFPEDYY